MGPLTLEQLQERLKSQHPEQKLAALGQLWQSFGLRCAFLESMGANAFSATVVAECGVGSLKEVAGMLSLQITPYHAVIGTGVRERPDNAQFFLLAGEKELHLTWPGGLPAMLEDERFRWVVQRLSSRPGSG